MMKSLLTRCPYCGAHFYKNTPENDISYVNIICPYCNYQYKDSIDEERIKKHDFYWEIYSGLYPPIKSEIHKKSRLTISGVLLLLTLPFFIYGLSQIFFQGALSSLSVVETNTIYGVWLAGLIFLLFVIAGIISALKRYSFVISLSGIIFALLSSVLWLYIYQRLDQHMFDNFYQLLMFGPQILSLISLTLIIKNRKSFKLGY